MIKNLYMHERSGKILVSVDDLKFDGKNLIIPSYWTSVLTDYFEAVDVSQIRVVDREDFNAFKKFLIDVQDNKNKTAQKGN